MASFGKSNKENRAGPREIGHRDTASSHSSPAFTKVKKYEALTHSVI